MGFGVEGEFLLDFFETVRGFAVSGMGGGRVFETGAFHGNTPVHARFTRVGFFAVESQVIVQTFSH